MLSKIAENFGADGLLIINPYYNKGNKSGIKAHFTKIAQSVDTPIIIYNVPSRTGVNLSPNLIAELSYNEPNIVAVKEASGDLTQVAEIARLVDDDFAIYSGNDDSTLPLLSLGGVGVISVLANICPKESHDLVYSFLDGNIGLSRKLQLDLKPLIDALFLEVNPVPVKTAMNLIGMEVGNLRLPLGHMQPNNLELLKKELKCARFELK